jgi:hypothetical protein
MVLCTLKCWTEGFIVCSLYNRLLKSINMNYFSPFILKPIFNVQCSLYRVMLKCKMPLEATLVMVWLVWVTTGDHHAPKLCFCTVLTTQTSWQVCYRSYYATSPSLLPSRRKR